MTGLHLFTLAGIPVRATLGFFGLVLLYGYQLSAAGIGSAAGFILGTTISILIHEFGHGLVARRYRLAPQIELHFWGGRCFHEYARKDRHHILIVLGGPLLQMVVGGLAWLALALLKPAWLQSPGLAAWGGFATAFASWFVWVSVIWGALNLFAPIWPLDGGQLFRMILLRFIKPPAKAEKVLHLVGLLLSIAIVVYGVTSHSTFLAILAAMWGLENGRYFAYGSGPAPIRLRSELADKLLAEAAQRVVEHDWHEARRLAFQARDEKTITDDQLARVFELLTVSSAELGDWHESLAWSPRAPRTPAAFVARLKSLAGVGRAAQARSELNASDAVRLAPEVREGVVAWIDGARGP